MGANSFSNRLPSEYTFRYLLIPISYQTIPFHYWDDLSVEWDWAWSICRARTFSVLPSRTPCALRRLELIQYLLHHWRLLLPWINWSHTSLYLAANVIATLSRALRDQLQVSYKDRQSLRCYYLQYLTMSFATTPPLFHLLGTLFGQLRKVIWRSRSMDEEYLTQRFPSRLR